MRKAESEEAQPADKKGSVKSNPPKKNNPPPKETAEYENVHFIFTSHSLLHEILCSFRLG